jgi:hypothetical protein
MKALTLTETNQKIIDRYAELATEHAQVRAETPEDFETLAEISAEMRGIKYVIDLLSETKFF